MLKPRITEGHAEAFADIAQEMHFHTPTLVVYVLGTLGVAYHLANGAPDVLHGAGASSPAGGLRRLEWVAIAVSCCSSPWRGARSMRSGRRARLHPT